MPCRFSGKVLFVEFAIILAYRGAAQTPTLSLSSGPGAPGDSITMTVSLSFNRGTRPAAVQWDLSYSTADLIPSKGAFFSTGVAASAAGKSVACSVPAPGSVRCIVAGLNKTAIADGAVASVTFQIVPTTRSSSTSVSIVKTQGADRTGAALNMNGAIATIIITQGKVSLGPRPLAIDSEQMRLPTMPRAGFSNIGFLRGLQLSAVGKIA